jgi:DNA-binding PadR family transcriptional regulator
MAPRRTAELNATQGSLLGFLSDGPKTGWDILQLAGTTLARFWSVTPSHVYRELQSLERRRLVKAEPKGPRDRQPYSITAAGRAAFRTWIAQEPGPEQVRFPLLVTLWFGRHLDDATLARFVEQQRAEHASRLEMYEDVAERIASGDMHIAAVVDFGVRYERAIVEWLDALPYRAPVDVVTVDAVAPGEAS